MKKRVTWVLILALTAAMMSVGCGKAKEPELDVVDLTVPPVETEAEEAAPE